MLHCVCTDMTLSAQLIKYTHTWIQSFDCVNWMILIKPSQAKLVNLFHFVVLIFLYRKVLSLESLLSTLAIVIIIHCRSEFVYLKKKKGLQVILMWLAISCTTIVMFVVMWFMFDYWLDIQLAMDTDGQICSSVRQMKTGSKDPKGTLAIWISLIHNFINELVRGHITCKCPPVRLWPWFPWSLVYVLVFCLSSFFQQFFVCLYFTDTLFVHIFIYDRTDIFVRCQLYWDIIHVSIILLLIQSRFHF